MGIVAAVLGLLALSLVGLVAVAGYRWRSTTAGIVARLNRGDVTLPSRFSVAELEGLPAPVDYEERDGMRIPREGEVEWLLPEGPQVYWRGRIVDVAYGP